MKIGIVGLGNFGKTILNLIPKPTDIVAYDIDPDHIPSGVAIGSIEDACSCDVVILSVPISAYDRVFGILAVSLPRTSVLIDVCSVKTPAERYKEQYLPDHTSYLSVHPLFGPRSIEMPGSRKKVVVTTRGDQKATEILERAEDALALEVLEMSTEEHDRTAAYTQALTFFLGDALRDFLPENPLFTPPSYGLLTGLRDFVGHTSPQLVDTIEANPYFNQTITTFAELISKKKDLLS